VIKTNKYFSFFAPKAHPPLADIPKRRATPGKRGSKVLALRGIEVPLAAMKGIG